MTRESLLPAGRGNGPRPAAALLALAVLLAADAGAGSVRRGLQAPEMSGQVVDQWTGHYDISAHLFIVGNLGNVGAMTIESSQRKEGERLEKSLHMAGASSEGQIKRNRDYRGDFSLLKVLPLRPDGSIDEEAVRQWQGYESSSSGSLKLNKKYQAEKNVFFEDHAVATRESGAEKRVEGAYGSILSPLEYMMDHDLKVGQVFETPFILNGIPRVFRCEVTDLDNFSDYPAQAYRVDIWAVDKAAGADRAPKDVWKKKGNVRVWFCKDGPYQNQMIRMKIKFRWYLWLYFDLKK